LEGGDSMKEKHVKGEKGQIFVEFALCLPIFIFLTFTIFTLSFRALGKAYVQEAAFEAARCYSVTENADRAENLAKKTFESTGGNLFIKPDSLTVWFDFRNGGKQVEATARATPRDESGAFLYGYCDCKMEGRYIKPEDYLK
jgi:hypothetical protein